MAGAISKGTVASHANAIFFRWHLNYVEKASMKPRRYFYSIAFQHVVSSASAKLNQFETFIMNGPTGWLVEGKNCKPIKDVPATFSKNCTTYIRAPRASGRSRNKFRPTCYDEGRGKLSNLMADVLTTTIHNTNYNIAILEANASRCDSISFNLLFTFVQVVRGWVL